MSQMTSYVFRHGSVDHPERANFKEYVRSEANIIEREHIFKLNCLAALEKDTVFLSPVTPYGHGYSYDFCKAILIKEMTDELLDFVLELKNKEFIKFLVYNEFLTEGQKFKILIHPNVSSLDKSILSESLPRSLITWLLHDKTGLKRYACYSNLLTEDEVLQLLQFNDYFERLYFNKHVSVDLFYENFFVKNRGQLVSYSDEETDEKQRVLLKLEYVLFHDWFEELKNVLSRNFNINMSAYDEKWVKTFLNWKIELNFS